MSEKPRYERPVFVRHELGAMNKFGRVQSMKPMESIGGVPIDELVETYGSPLFVFSEKTLIDRYTALRDALSLRWPKVRMAWSYKTNYLEGICRVFHEQGAWAEVVSEFEYDKALHHGIAPDRIHFNGPLKERAVLERALPAGTIIHIDHFDELALVEKIAREKNITPGVAIRVNLSATGVPAWSRFGFNLESGQAFDAARHIKSRGILNLVGVHCHLGTFVLEPDGYRDQAKKLAEFANKLSDDLGIRLQFLDLGGGIPSHNTLKAQYLPGDQSTPSFSRYAEAIADGLSDLKYPSNELPTLVMENGRALVDDAGFLVSTVHANKRMPDGRRAVILDAGVNTLFTAFWYKHDAVPTRKLSGLPEPTILYGPLCMNIDVVRDTMLFPPLEVGDKLVFRNVGAYNVTQWMQFITYRPAVVMVGKNGKHALLRRRENLESVISHEETPPWLKS